MGKYLPDNVVTNDDLSKIMDTSDEWIQERTGIKQRRHIKKGRVYGRKSCQNRAGTLWHCKG